MVLNKLLRILGFKKDIKLYGFNYSVYNRIIPISDILKEKDFNRGFGMDFSFYIKVMKKREEMFI